MTFRRGMVLGFKGESGSATVLVVGCLSIVLVAGGASAAVGEGVATRHRAQRSADLVAISAATAIGSARAACDEALRVAAANDVVLRTCVEDLDPSGRTGSVRVVIARHTSLPLLGEQVVSARARAGRVRP